MFRLSLVIFVFFVRSLYAHEYKVSNVVLGLENPWSFVFLPSGDLLVSERGGKLKLIDMVNKSVDEVIGLPEVFFEGQGGLLDVVLDPNFEFNRLIYFSFSEKDEDKYGTAVARACLLYNQLDNVQIIFRQDPKTEGTNHYGSRLRFDWDRNLYVTLGEKFNYMDEAQKLDNHLGKIVRIDWEGNAIADNPYVGQEDKLAEIWSYGHRNIQGAAIHPETGDLWINEHGPKGGDEVNLIKKGKNYGWPEASYGSHYWLTTIPDEHLKRGFEEPIHHWTPAIAPSGMIFYQGDKFPNWQGDIFVGALRGKHISKLTLDSDNNIIEEIKLLEDFGYRIRDIKEGPDGFIYFAIDSSEGKIMRIEPI